MARSQQAALQAHAQKKHPAETGKNGPFTFIGINKTTGYDAYYDEETRTIVARWFREDIKALDYTF